MDLQTKVRAAYEKAHQIIGNPVIAKVVLLWNDSSFTEDYVSVGDVECESIDERAAFKWIDERTAFHFSTIDDMLNSCSPTELDITEYFDGYGRINLEKFIADHDISELPYAGEEDFTIVGVYHFYDCNEDNIVIVTDTDYKAQKDVQLLASMRQYIKDVCAAAPDMCITLHNYDVQKGYMTPVEFYGDCVFTAYRRGGDGATYYQMCDDNGEVMEEYDIDEMDLYDLTALCTHLLNQ